MLLDDLDIWVDKILHYKVTKVRIILGNGSFVGAEDENMRDHLNKPLGNKYTSHDIQNELLEILTHHVGKLKKLEKCFFYNGRRVYSHQQ